MAHRRSRSRRRYRFVTIGMVTVALLTLTGCGETLEERAANRDQCESLGGEYVEHRSGWTHEYSGWNCDLSTETEED